jgi:hypothetical protein
MDLSKSKLTSKIHRPSGRWKSFETPCADLSVKKRMVGYVVFDKTVNKYVIYFRVHSDTVQGGWFANRKLKYDGANTIQEAIQFAKDNWTDIHSKHKIVPAED